MIEISYSFHSSRRKHDIFEDCHKTSTSDNSLAENIKICFMYTYILRFHVKCKCKMYSRQIIAYMEIYYFMKCAMEKGYLRLVLLNIDFRSLNLSFKFFFKFIFKLFKSFSFLYDSIYIVNTFPSLPLFENK